MDVVVLEVSYHTVTLALRMRRIHDFVPDNIVEHFLDGQERKYPLPLLPQPGSNTHPFCSCVVFQNETWPLSTSRRFENVMDVTLSAIVAVVN